MGYCYAKAKFMLLRKNQSKLLYIKEIDLLLHFVTYFINNVNNNNSLQVNNFIVMLYCYHCYAKAKFMLLRKNRSKLRQKISSEICCYFWNIVQL